MFILSLENMLLLNLSGGQNQRNEILKRNENINNAIKKKNRTVDCGKKFRKTNIYIDLLVISTFYLNWTEALRPNYFLRTGDINVTNTSLRGDVKFQSIIFHELLPFINQFDTFNIFHFSLLIV